MTMQLRTVFLWKQFVAVRKRCIPNISKNSKRCPFHPNPPTKNDDEVHAEAFDRDRGVRRICLSAAEPVIATAFTSWNASHPRQCVPPVRSRHQHYRASGRAGGGVGRFRTF